MPDNKEAHKGFYPCRVCGLDQGYDMWKPMSHSICPCCACEFGIDDDSLSLLRKYRMNWLTNGAVWWHEKQKRKPVNWNTIEDLTNQLKNIPYEWW